MSIPFQPTDDNPGQQVLYIPGEATGQQLHTGVGTQCVLLGVLETVTVCNEIFIA